MRTLIVEDDVSSRIILEDCLKSFGPVDVAATGTEAVGAYKRAIIVKKPYDLICLDIMLPEKSGQDVLLEIRLIEEKMGVRLAEGVKILMTTALGDGTNVMKAFREACDAYLVKPIDQEKLIKQIKAWFPS